ncbi:MAG: 2-succinyl-5-enolpyruvyl-6-hydroxy-3-cyclohexene-1-carboxylic-acid synthase [Crocinitomicaceae bacterium]|nr:2-succinyl-5-enolpyruvyl-6-hydroxy-3-cyclohexene-1-carboxylic-acid synthase [Crocinitomicaceae bacterium]
MKHVVCSPGSRNAALVIALDNHPDVETFIIHDERSAAFYALGMAQQLDAPVGVVCTSGSAMLNYYPAVAEAFYQCIPLIVITADRPEEWVNHGDGQTIVQKGVYTNHIKDETTIPEVIITEEEKIKLDQDVDTAFRCANGDWKGPIHFNCPISEPMYDMIDVEQESGYVSTIDTAPFDFTEELKSALGAVWESSKRKLILCGQMDKNSAVATHLGRLAEDGSVLVLVENTSNLIHPKFIHCIDRTMSAIGLDEMAEYEPDLLISIGGAIVSKRIKKFLRDCSIKAHWKVGHAFPEMDTYRALTRSIECSPNRFFNELLKLDLPMHTSSFGLKWKKKDYLVQNKLPGFFQSSLYSDLTVFETLLDYIPENAILHMGNSSVVRYCQLFDPIPSIRYYGNRGTSGIDGCTSTACGAALATKNKLNVLITGDVSFLYDSNALWSNHLTENLRIILINNGGGGIFRIIDGPNQLDQLEKYFEAKHQFSAEKICEAFNVDYMRAHTLDEVEKTMDGFYAIGASDQPKLIEVFTPQENNPVVLKELFSYLA